MTVTFAIAEILADDDGRITMLADTKVTVTGNTTLTRHVYTEPCLKIVIVDRDIAVAVAGDNPDTAIRHVIRLRGRPSAEIVESLRQYSADHARIKVSKSFLIAERAPDPKLWRITLGKVEENGRLPRLWIGDQAAFAAFQRQYAAALRDSWLERRLVVAVQAVVLSDDIPTVGGYVTRVTGGATRPFTFCSDPAGSGPWMTEGTIVEQNGEQVLMMRVPPGGDPTQHSRVGVPGHGDTFGAMAYFIPEIGTALLWPHDAPWRPAILLTGVPTMHDVVQTAAQEHGQLLSPAKLLYP